MIRLRDSQGKAFRVNSDVRFIEICDNAGKLAGLVGLDPKRRTATVSLPGDVEFENYKTAFRLGKAVVLIPKKGG